MSATTPTAHRPVREDLVRTSLTNLIAFDYAGRDPSRRKAVLAHTSDPDFTVRLPRLKQSAARTAVASNMRAWAIAFIALSAVLAMVTDNREILYAGAFLTGVTLFVTRRWKRASFVVIETRRAHHYWDAFMRAKDLLLASVAKLGDRAEATNKVRAQAIELQDLIEKFEKLAKTANELDGQCSTELRKLIDTTDRAMYELVVAATLEAWQYAKATGTKPAPHRTK